MKLLRKTFIRLKAYHDNTTINAGKSTLFKRNSSAQSLRPTISATILYIISVKRSNVIEFQEALGPRRWYGVLATT